MTEQGDDASTIAGLRAEVQRLHESLRRLNRPVDDRLKDAGELLKAERMKVTALEERCKRAEAQVSPLTLQVLDAKDAVKDRAWFLLLEGDGGTFPQWSLTLFEDPSQAQRAHEKCIARTAFLCSVLRGPMDQLNRLVKSFVGV